MEGIYNYSLIRAVPDERRGEWVNVGVVIYLDGRLDVRLLRNLSKVRMLSPLVDLSVFENLSSIWNEWATSFETPEQIQQVLSRMPLLRASPISMFTCAPQQYDAQVEDIMRDLVTPPPQKREGPTITKLETKLRGHFARSKILGRSISDIDRHLVVHRYPVAPDEELFADFALRNGTLRITETIDFRTSVDTIRQAKRGQAALKAITLDRATQKLHGDCIPSVVYAANSETLELIQPSLNMLSSYCERLYDAENQSDMAAYLGMMAAAAFGQQMYSFPTKQGADLKLL